MAGIIKSKLEGLSPEVLDSLHALRDTVMDNDTIIMMDGDNARVNTDHLSALIELLTAEKKRAKAIDEENAAADREKAKAIAAAAGAESAKTLAVGDTVSFTMGSGKGKKVFTRKVIKVTDKTFHVEFDDAYPCTTSAAAPIGKKFVKFAAIVVGSIVKAAVAEAVAA